MIDFEISVKKLQLSFHFCPTAYPCDAGTPVNGGEHSSAFLGQNITLFRGFGLDERHLDLAL